MSNPNRITIPLLWATAGIIAIFHATWLAEDRRVPFWDQMRYLKMSDRAVEQLAAGSAAGILDLHPSHPPLYPILGAVSARVLGDGFFGARSVNVLLSFVLVFLTHALARRRLGPWPSLLAAFLTGFLPLASSIAHLYYIENLLAPIVVLSVYLLDLSAGFSRRLPSLLFGAVAGLGMLVKWTFPIFVLPVAMVVFLRSRHRSRAFLPLLLALAIALPWYVTHISGLLTFIDEGVTGGAGHLSEKTGVSGWAYYPKILVVAAAGVPVALALGFECVARIWRRAGAVEALLLVILPIVVFGCVLTKKPRHILPIMPFVAILAAAAITRIPRIRWRIATGALVAVHVLASSFLASFGPAAVQVEFVLGNSTAPLFTRSHNDDPGLPDRCSWPYDAILDAMAQAESQNGERPTLLVLFNSAAFRDVGFEYMARKRNMDLRVGLLPLFFPQGHPGHHVFPFAPETGEGELGLSEADWIVAKSGVLWTKVQSGLPVHRDNARVAEAIFDPDSPLRAAFESVSDFPLPDGSIARLFRARGGADRIATLARFALRWSRTNHPSWRALGEPVPEADNAVNAAVRLGILPARLGMAFAATDSESCESLTKQAFADTPDREEVQEAVLTLLPFDHGLAVRSRRLLALRDAYRMGPDSFVAALALAADHESGGEEASALVWLRRAMEADSRRSTQAADIINRLISRRPR